jgi:hypothetical protein
LFWGLLLEMLFNKAWFSSMSYSIECHIGCYMGCSNSNKNKLQNLSVNPETNLLSLINQSLAHIYCTTLLLNHELIRQCLVPSKFQKFYKIPRHIKSLDACIEH